MNKIKTIKFGSDTAHRKQWFKGLSFAHPAKMHLSLQFYLIEHYTKPGDTIIDPMAGSGTILVACALGRNIICVELEEKYIKMQQANWEKIKSLGAILGYTMGKALIRQGDARALLEVLADYYSKNNVDECRLSGYNSKYANIKTKKETTSRKHTKENKESKLLEKPTAEDRENVSAGQSIPKRNSSNIQNPPSKYEPNIKTVENTEQTKRSAFGKKALGLQKRIGKPIISQTHKKNSLHKMRNKKESGNTSQRFQPLQQQAREFRSSLRKLPHSNTQESILESKKRRETIQKKCTNRLEKIDKVIFSPSYAETEASANPKKWKDPEKAYKKMSARAGKNNKAHPFTPEAREKYEKKKLQGLPENSNNISNLPYGSIDGIITRPPYQNEPTCSESYKKIRTAIGRDTTKPSQKYKKYSEKADCICTSPPYEHQGQGQGKEYHPERMVGSETGLGRGYGDTQANIGNLKADNYLSAMLQVYQGCFRILKDNGLMCLVTKNFIRNKQIVRLDLDTIKLCEQAGFTLIEQLKRKLTQQSFWRTIYKQKYPTAPEIKNEDILIFRKN